MMKIYKKQFPGESGYTMRIDATLHNIDIDKVTLMNRDIYYRQNGAKPPKEIRVVEETSKYSDVVYTEMNFPFPMSNREFLQKRLFVSNKADPEIVKHLGLWDWGHRYNVIVIQSTEKEDFPVKEKPVRAETKMNYTLLEEDPSDRNVVRMKVVIDQDLKGDIPKFVVNSFADKMPKIIMNSFLNSYTKFFGKNAAA